jgi:hypothetical protein
MAEFRKDKLQNFSFLRIQEKCTQFSFYCRSSNMLDDGACDMNAVGQSALPTLWGLRRSSTERRNDRFLMIGKL